MGDTYNIEVLLKAQLEESKKIIGAIDEIKGKANRLAEQATATSRVVSGALFDVGARLSSLALKIPSIATTAIKSFGEQEVAVQKLTAAIRANGGNVAEIVPIYREFAAEMQRATTYGDEQILAIQGVATSMGVLPNQMRQVIEGAIGLSSALGMDLQTAARASAAAIQGKTEALSRYIPMLSECKTDEEKFAKVQELSRSGFAQAKAEADSTLGKLKACANAWSDLSETVGAVFAPVATDVATLLKSLCELLAEHETATRILTTGIASLALALTFSKIGGLISVAKAFIGLGSAIRTADTATKALNMTLRASPLGVAVTAVSALTMAYSYFKGKAEETYKANIEKSKEYRDAIEAEISTLKQWGIAADANKKRSAEVAAEIEKLRKERDEFEKANRIQVNTGSAGGISGFLDPKARGELDNYNAKISQLEKLLQALAPASDLAALAQKNHAEAVAKSEAILKQYDAELRASQSANEALKKTQNERLSLEKEIAALESAFNGGGIADSERVAKANRLVQAKKELVKLGELELRQIMAMASAEREAAKTAELKKQYQLEANIAGANVRNDAALAKSLQKELEQVKVQQRRLELINSYIDSLRGEIQCEEDLKRIKDEAARRANAIISAEQKAQAETQARTQAAAETEKWLNAENEKQKSAQLDIELEILEARADGQEELAKEKEGKLRVAQLAHEIFETARKEGMTRKELQTLQDTAEKQARERYNLEKSITEEAQRQNLAKNAAAAIEDIILKNKIEQLKAEGKIAAAKELEREREIRRTLAGMGDAVSDADKEMLGDMMRQTNDYQDRQSERQFGGGRSDRAQRRSSSGNRSRGGIEMFLNRNISSGGGSRASQTRGRSSSSGGNSGTYNFGTSYSVGKKGAYNFGVSYSVGKNEKRDEKSEARAAANGILSNAAKTASALTKQKTAEQPKQESSKTEEKTETKKQQTPARAELSNRTSSPAAGGNTQSLLLAAVLSIERAVRGLEQTKI